MVTLGQLTFGEYLEASRSGDSDAYYKNHFGDDWEVKSTYHLKVKAPNKLEGFNVVTDVDDMVFGQFIAGEQALTSGLSNDIAIEMLALNIIRPIEDVEFDNTNVEKEQRHRENVLSQDVRDVWDTLDKYVAIRDKYVKEKYKGVFYISKDEDEEDEEEIDGTDSSGGVEESFTRQWYWYSIARSLAEDGIVFEQRSNMSKVECVFMTKMGSIAPELAYKRQRSIIEEARERKIRALQNIKR